MRADFYSVVTDGNANRYPDAQWTRVAIRDDDDPTPLGHTRDFSKSWREGRNFRYSLVKRYLRSQVGRPFDEVTSAIARTLRGTDDGVHRVMQAVTHYVTNSNGTDHHGRIESDIGVYHRRPLFVDKAGILREGPGKAYSTRTSATRRALGHLIDPDRVPVTSAHSTARNHACLDRVDGHWFLSRWERHEGSRLGVAVITLTVYGYPTAFQDGPATRRQISSRDIRRLGLSAWADDAEALAASISGRDYDDVVEARQRKRLAAAPRLLATGSNRLG